MNSSDSGKSSASITRTYYALETFCENLGNVAVRFIKSNINSFTMSALINQLGTQHRVSYIITSCVSSRIIIILFYCILNFVSLCLVFLAIFLDKNLAKPFDHRGT